MASYDWSQIQLRPGASLPAKALEKGAGRRKPEINGRSKQTKPRDALVPRRRRKPFNEPLLSSFGKSMKQFCQELSTISLGELSKQVKDDMSKIRREWKHHKDWTTEEAHLAAEILHRMEQEPDIKTTAKDFVNVMNAFAKQPEDGTDAAEGILDYMQSCSEDRPHLRPDRFAINTLISAYAMSNKPGSAQQAERLLKMLERDYAKGDWSRKPNSRSYGKVINAYAREGKPDKAKEILRRLEDQVRSGNADVEPEVPCYTPVISSYAKSGRAQEAEAVLFSMISFYESTGLESCRPGVNVFSAVIGAWSKSKDPCRSERAFAILDLMKEHNVERDIVTCSNVLALLTSTKSMRQANSFLRNIEADSNLVADRTTYNILLKAYSSQKGCGEKAEKLLKHWVHEFNLGKVREMPDAYSCCLVMSCWDNTMIRDAAAKENQILVWMERNNVTANIFVYNRALMAWSRSPDSEAVAHAEGIWNRMHEHDKYSYIHMLNVYVRAEDQESLDKAEKLLKEGFSSNAYRPDLHVCTSLVAGFAAWGAEDAGERCEGLLDWMELIAIKPDTVCYNSTINAYKKNNHLQAASRAIALYDRMRRYQLRPSCATYSLLVNACKDDSEFLIYLFKDCVEEGMLDRVLVKSFRQVGPPAVVGQLRGGVPYDWRRNTTAG